MKLKLPKLKFKKGAPKDPKAKGKARRVAEQIFGFEKVDKSKYLKSPRLNQDEIIATLVRLETNQNWIKRILWLVAAGSGASHFLA